MKITFVIYGLGSGGAERAVTGLANYWGDTHEVAIITMVKSYSFYPLKSNIKLNHCLKSPKSTTNHFSTIKDSFKRIRTLVTHLKNEKPDVVISFMTKTNIYAIWACKWLDIPCVISERANHELNPLPRLQEVLRDFSYSYSKALVVQTKGNQSYYVRNINLTKVNVIPNAISDNLQVKRNEFIGTEKKVILNVGAFRDGKAQDILIQAFAKLRSQDWKLIFLGEGPNLEKYKELAVSLGVGDKVIFKGAQKDVASYYTQASIFVFTSEHEGFPNALLEALYFGLPCISTNCPHGPSDMITDGENGFLVPVGDVDVLTEKMKLLMNSQDLQLEFIKNAKISTQKYEMEPIANKWMEVIKTALSQ